MSKHRASNPPIGEGPGGSQLSRRGGDREWWPAFPALDVLVPAVLALGVLLAWCAANGKWTAQAWALPTTYVHDAERGDFLANAAQLKAAANWSGIPFRWKNVAELGAPYDGNWNDFPSLDETVVTLQVVLTRAMGLFPGMNAVFVIAHVLAALAAYAASRLSGSNRLWAAVAGLAFGISPFIFAQSPHHVSVAYAWPVAFLPLAWRAVATSDGLEWGTRQWWWMVALGFIIGLHFVYFTNVFCQLVLLGAAVQYYRTRKGPPFLAALALIAAAALGFAVNNVDSWTYRLFHEPNVNAFVRDYKWLELYGLKIKDLFIPPTSHRSDVFSAFSAAHWQSAPLLDEKSSYLGIVGIGALLWLLLTGVRAMVERRERDVPLEVWQILWIVLMFTTGGLNAILGSAGITMFRAGCRYSVVILVISLLWAARRLTDIQARSEASHPGGATTWQWYAVASAIVMLVFWDQVPRSPTTEETSTIVRLIDSDREFTRKMEAALPEGAMIFQLPIMEYPESPVPGVPSYDHFRPYLYSTQLRYSFGSMKGRPREAWQQELGKLPLEEAVAEIEKRRFAAIYINRNGFPERAEPIEKALRAMGYGKPPIVSATGDLVCIPLEKP